MMRLRNQLVLVCLCSLTWISCNTSRNGLFGKKSPHDQYANKLSQAGLETTTLGRAWLAAADRALQRPVTIQLPYKETGFFPSEQPSASGYSLQVKQGEKLSFQVAVKPANVNVFADLWKIGPDGNRSFISATDSSSFLLEYEADVNVQLIVRVQPELLNAVEYTITINTGPTLAFPVQSSDNPRVSSFWGAARDGGSRNHEGIDIFATKRTPAVAAADGRVTRVNENNLGGKVVFLRPKGKSYNLYYAHLDSQIVTEGQQVNEGDVIGLIGNTGNARTTPPHLHFGIYATGGAVDPFPFVNQNRPKPKEITASLNSLNKYARTKSSSTIQSSQQEATSVVKIPSNGIMKIIAASSNWYKVQTPDGAEGFIKDVAVTLDPVRSVKLNSITTVFDKPDLSAATKAVIPANSTISLLGSFGNFDMIQHNEIKGWIQARTQ